MAQSQLELLVLYQDIHLMLQEAEEEKIQFGFSVDGIDELKQAQGKLAKKIENRYLRTYERLKTRFRRAIVPVKENVCLGCFAKLPTSYSTKHQNEQSVITCEHCGRILYWIE
jgi:predicted  nucleic acid-binding Zn-ribbon protein